MKHFSERFQYLLDKNNLKPARFAEMLPCNISQVGRWKKAKDIKQEGTILRLVSFFECDRVWLENGVGVPYPETPKQEAKNYKSNNVKLGKGATNISVGGDASNISTGNDPINLSPLEKEVILLNRSVGNEIYLKKLREKLLQLQEESGNIF